MTYCVGILVKEGLVMMADTRTNAGVDNVSTYRKLRCFDTGPGRCMTIASAGSLSVTQAAIAQLRVDPFEVQRTPANDGCHTGPSPWSATAAVTGRAVRIGAPGGALVWKLTAPAVLMPAKSLPAVSSNTPLAISTL